MRDKAQRHFRMKKGAPVTFGVVRCQRYCKAAGMSACTLFLDMRAAYYRVIKKIAKGDIRSDDVVLRILRRPNLVNADFSRKHARRHSS